MKTIIFDKDYIINWAEEVGWALLTGAAIIVLPMVLTASDKIGVWGGEDWKTWGLAVGIAVGRSATATIANRVRQLLGLSEDP